MAGIEEKGSGMQSSVQEDDEAVNLSVELKQKLSVEQKEKAKKEEEKWRKVEETIEYYKRLILTRVESLLISEDHAPYYRGGVDQIRSINERIRKTDKVTKALALKLLRRLLDKHGIRRGYIKYSESNLPLDFLRFLAEHMN